MKNKKNFYIYLWSRNKNLNYGARKYIEPFLNFIKNSKNKQIELNERFLTKSKKPLIQISQSLFMILFRGFFHLIDYFFYYSKENTKIIYQFPFIPFLTPFSKRNSLIIILHHVDYETNSLKNNICDFFGLIVITFYPKDIKFVVVSEIWRDFLICRGFKNINLIRNSLPNKLSNKVNLILEKNSTLKKRDFKNFYLGGASSAKGWSDCVSVIREYFPNASLWISSQYQVFLKNKEKSLLKKYRIELKVLNSYTEYIDNLIETDCCIFNSNFKECWNRSLVESALISDGIILAKEIGGMNDVIKIFPNIKSFKNLAELSEKLNLISSKNDDEKLLIRQRLNQKRILLLKSNFLDEFSESNFIDKWLKLLHS